MRLEENTTTKKPPGNYFLLNPNLHISDSQRRVLGRRTYMEYAALNITNIASMTQYSQVSKESDTIKATNPISI